jgi:hypothetical protein
MWKGEIWIDVEGGKQWLKERTLRRNQKRKRA